MKYYLNQVKHLIKRHISTVQIIGYPKSGNTWLKMLVLNYFLIKNGLENKRHLHSDYAINFFNKMPNIMWSHGIRKRDRLISHSNIDPALTFKRKTVFLTRDPRDVIPSFYNHEVYRNGMKKYKPSIWRKMFSLDKNSDLNKISKTGYIKSKIRGIKDIITFDNFWFNNRNKFPSFMLVRYEDMHKDSSAVLIKILRFMGEKKIDSKIVKRAVSESSFKKMRAIELSKDLKEADLGTPTDVDDLRTYKCRKGKVGEHKDFYLKKDLSYVQSRIKKELNPYFGYH